MELFGFLIQCVCVCVCIKLSQTHVAICHIEAQESCAMCWMEPESSGVYAILFHRNLGEISPFIRSDVHHAVNIVREYNLREGREGRRGRGEGRREGGTTRKNERGPTHQVPVLESKTTLVPPLTCLLSSGLIKNWLNSFKFPGSSGSSLSLISS